MMESQKDADKEKPQGSGVTESQGVSTNKISTNKDTQEWQDFRESIEYQTVYKFPARPQGAFGRTEHISTSGENDRFVNVHVSDENAEGLRPSDELSFRVSIENGLENNATNRVLAAICFFKWTGSEYVPCSLVESQPDMRLITIGNVDELSVE